MEGKTVKSMNLALERPTERLYVLGNGTFAK